MATVRELLRPWYLKWLYFRLRPQRQPSSFRACWQHREAPPDYQADFIFLPMGDWHGPRQRMQQLALALAARGHRCLYVNPHLGREFPQPYPFSRRSTALEVAPGVIELHVHLPLEPVFHHRLLTAAEEQRVATAIGPFAERGAVVISCFPLWNGVVDRLRRSHDGLAVYDCHDLIEGFENVAPELLEEEENGMKAADLVLFSSKTLANRWRISGGILLPNAGDPEHFRLLPWRPPPHRPVIGYIGALNHWLDSEAVARAAEQRPDWDFVLIGPIDTADVTRLRVLPNVRLEGPAAYEDLPQRMASFDVALIPFKLTPLIEAVNPVKLYEYLASGLPVVSAPLPEVVAFCDHVYTYGAGTEMSQAIEKALIEDRGARREARRAAVVNDTWASRAEELERALRRRA